MATQQLAAGNGIALPAGEDLQGKAFHLVRLNNSGQVVVPTASTDLPIGVLQNDPPAGGAAEVLTLAGAVAKVVADGSTVAIAVGDTVGTNASGKAVKKSLAGDWYIGVALDASAVDGKLIRVLLTGPQQRA
ncbi:MAG: hypothetical protein KatS3mg115_1375 [Candidatus Poribacteria bacterium]|nr:MAG: hypothetical protein KatS3mg115_1375 [Candidatus Poribacteria bacterium]